jgi:hypothetical protein
MTACHSRRMSNRAHPVNGRRGLARRGAGLAVVGLAALPVLPVMVGTAHAAGGFTTGDVVVYRVGNGSAALSSAATPVFLDEYPTTPAAAPTLSLALPTTTSPQDAVTASGTATSEGEISLSTDGSTLLATGYDAAAGTAGVAGTASSADPRVIAEVDGAGDIDTSTALSSLYSGNNIRSAAATSGASLFAAGPTNGVVATTKGSSTGTQLTPSSGDVNFRQAAIFGGQLYASSASGSTTTGIDAIGTGLPSGSTTVTNLPGLDSAGSPYGFVLFDETGGTGPDTAYVADSTAGKILKYVLSGSTWVADGSASSTATTGVIGLTGTYANGVATLYATSPTNLVSVSDPTGQGTLTATPTTLATAGTNEAFRGVAFAPTTPATTPPPSTPESPLTVALPAAAGVLLVGGGALRRRRNRRSA